MARISLAVLAALAVALVAVMPATAHKRGDGKRANTFIQNDCKRLQQKPRHIELACGKAKRHQDDVELKRVRYKKRSYGKNHTKARGRLHVRGVGHGKVHLRFERLRKCNNKHRRGGGKKGRRDNKVEVYRRVEIKLKDPTTGRRDRFKERLGCN